MQQPARRLLERVRALLALPLAVVLAGACTSEARRGDVLAVESRTPMPSSTAIVLPTGRAPACVGQPTPTSSPQYMRSYIDFVQLAGRLYALADVQPVGVVGGRRLGVVRCVYDDAQAPAEYGVMDGDASRLPIGTALLAHPDVDGRRAVVADRPEGPLLYVVFLQEGLGPRPSPSD